jgi:hypothetical protein
LSVRITKSASVNRIPPFRFSLEKEILPKETPAFLYEKKSLAKETHRGGSIFILIRFL